MYVFEFFLFLKVNIHCHTCVKQAPTGKIKNSHLRQVLD